MSFDKKGSPSSSAARSRLKPAQPRLQPQCQLDRSGVLLRIASFTVRDAPPVPLRAWPPTTLHPQLQEQRPLLLAPHFPAAMWFTRGARGGLEAWRRHGIMRTTQLGVVAVSVSMVVPPYVTLSPWAVTATT
jgi:hypothetical protein